MTGEPRCQYATTSRQSEYTGTTYMMISPPAVVGARWRGRRRNRECLQKYPAGLSGGGTAISIQSAR